MYSLQQNNIPFQLFVKWLKHLNKTLKLQGTWKDLVMPRVGGWIGSLQISETNAAVKTSVGTTDAVPELPRGRYFRYRTGTTDKSEVTKMKFEK
jgi:hypothetical protein